MQLNNYRGLCKDVTFPVENAAEIVTVVLDYRANFQIDFLEIFLLSRPFRDFYTLHYTFSRERDIPFKEKKERERENFEEISKVRREKNLFRDKFIIEA